MYIYSEKTKKRYDTVEDCLAAEDEFDRAEEIRKAENKKKFYEQKRRAAELDDAYKEMVVAERKYYDMYKQYHKDYDRFDNRLWLI